MSYTYAVIDSDAVSILQLQHFMGDYKMFQCNGSAMNERDGLNIILKTSPDIVFIHLDDQAGQYFQMTAELHQYMDQVPVFIGVSKSKDHAYNAIKNNFFDYWLLPYDEHDVRKSIMRLQKTLQLEATPKSICLKSYSDFQYLDTNEILYLKADNNATDFVMKDGRTISAFKTLKSFEDVLPKNFVRVHQSYIINVDYVSRVNYGKGICAFKNEKKELPFSKTYRENIEELKRVLGKRAISTLN